MTRRGPAPLLALSGVVVAVVWGLARGIWPSNLHNAVLALTLTFVGAYVLVQRPAHREGLILMTAGMVEAVLFLGRQLARAPDGSRWWGWLGVWPVAAGLALTTLAVVLFPDGRLPSPRWRPVVVPALVLAAACALLSALWPVEYAATGVATAHPLDLPGGDVAATVWNAVAHPAYAVLQLLWVPAVVLRWRRSGRLVRVQLAWVGLAALLSALALAVGLIGWGTPRAGLLSAGLVPIAAGWAIVHGQHLAAYSALSWLSRADAATFPADLARALAEAVGAPAASVWIGTEDDLDPVGCWPGSRTGSTTLAALRDPTADRDPTARERTVRERTVRPVLRDGTVIGALAVDKAELSPAEKRLLDDLAAQAVLLLEHLALVRAAARPTADLDRLTARERQVLDLMARGLSNAAICRELHLSIKTVEPVIGAIFTKLGLGQDAANNRRVLAVLAYLRA